MSAISLQRPADELAAQLSELLQLKAELLDAQARIGLHEPDSFALRALGSMLHDLYNGVEGMCNRIAKEIDRHVPTGGNWHRGSAVRAIDLCTADIDQFIAFLRMMASGSAADNSSEC